MQQLFYFCVNDYMLVDEYCVFHLMGEVKLDSEFFVVRIKFLYSLENTL